MGSILLFGCLSALISEGMAEPRVQVVDMSPVTQLAGRDVVRRAFDYQCLSSVSSELFPPEPSDAALSSWSIDVDESSTVEPCKITMPASLSDAYLSYFEDLSTWASAVESKASAVDTDCGADIFGLDLTKLCESSQTVYFTGRANATGATPTSGASSTVLEIPDFPTGTIMLGEGSGGSSRSSSSSTANEGSRNYGLVGVAVTVAFTLGVAIIL